MTISESRRLKDAASEPVERLDPDSVRGDLVEAEHLGRYQWAASAARGREVLDVGSGTGYGADLIAAAGASRTVGVDLSGAVVEEARRRFGARGAEFDVADATALPFEDASFDLVTCFEVIEHVADQAAVVSELARVVRPGGMLLISSPNRGRYPPGNPFHVHELTAEELEALLGASFGHVKLLRQHNWIASAILDDDAYAASDPDVPVEAEVRKLQSREPGTELYTLAACGHGPVEAPPARLLLTHGLEVRRWVDQLARLAELESTRRALAAAEQELLELRDRHSVRMGELEQQAYWVQKADVDPERWMRNPLVRLAVRPLRFLRRVRRRLRRS